MKSNVSVNFTFSPVKDDKNDMLETAMKLHKQFGHPVESGKLKKLLHEAGIFDEKLEKAIEKVIETCDTCSRYKKARSRPVVCFSLAKDFNECLVLDY